MSAQSSRISLLAACAVIVGACLLFLPWLGWSGLAASEGFRAIPAWEMLSRNDWTIPHLFEQPYLRKPPGLPWAIAIASSCLGTTELAARLPSALSAIAIAFASFLFASRWFGPRAGFFAGFFSIVTPLFLMPARSAEIEALHNALTLISALLLLHGLNAPTSAGSPRTTLLSRALLALCFGGMLLTKGPSGLPVVGGALLACCFVQRSFRPLLSWTHWLALFAGAAMLALWLWRVRVGVESLTLPPVTQSAAGFLWSSGKAGAIVSLPVIALAGALPGSLGLISLALPRRPWEAVGTAPRMATATALACIFALLIYSASGVSNNRYAMPALTLCPIIGAAALARLATAPAPSFLRRAFWNTRIVWSFILTIGAIAHVMWFETRRENRTSGRDAGIALGECLPIRANVASDEFLDTRPEVLWYARAHAATRHNSVRIRWTPDLALSHLADPPSLVILRTDSRAREHALVDPSKPAAPYANTSPTCKGGVHVFEFQVFYTHPSP